MKNILLVLRHTKQQLDKDIKYQGIIKAMERKGYCVWRSYSKNEKIYLSNGEKELVIGKSGKAVRTISRNTSLYKAVYNYIKSTKEIFELCYIRKIPAFHGYKKMLRALCGKGIKIAVEIPTYPDKGEVESQGFINKIFTKVLEEKSKKAAQYIDVYLPMGEEVHEINGRPAVNIENGVETEFLTKREYTPVNPGEVHMIAVAKIARWHGYDRVIEGMKLYYDKNPNIKVYFHLVGPDGDGTLEKYKKLIEKYGLESYVLLEGPKYEKEADAYFDMADVAIASINIQGMKTVYPLKIVEYMARGIPFVYAASQCQVRPDWDFCMSVPVDGTPIDIERIVAFSKKANSVENVSDRMREIAKRDCSWDEQMDRMFNYFKEAEKR